MFVKEFFVWWYGRGYTELFKRLSAMIARTWQNFSVELLLKTLFEPWKKIAFDYGKSVQGKLRALLDNVVSRAVGLSVRLAAIFAALMSVVLMGIFGIVVAILWPLAPVLIILSLAWPLL